jgi:hypothetical protein
MYNIATWPNDCKLGAYTLKSAALIAADTTGTSYELGKGKFRVVVTWTACEVDNNNELYNIVLEANTRAATSTYYKIGALGAYGAAEVTGDTADTATSGAYECIIDNPYDYQVRYRVYVNGTMTNGMNFSVIAYPVATKY